MVNLDDAEERAAIMEYDGGMTRAKAEQATAELRGYKSWKEMMDALGRKDI